jgi:hypothetical protein
MKFIAAVGGGSGARTPPPCIPRIFLSKANWQWRLVRWLVESERLICCAFPLFSCAAKCECVRACRLQIGLAQGGPQYNAQSFRNKTRRVCHDESESEHQVCVTRISLFFIIYSPGRHDIKKGGRLIHARYSRRLHCSRATAAHFSTAQMQCASRHCARRDPLRFNLHTPDKERQFFSAPESECSKRMRSHFSRRLLFPKIGLYLHFGGG